MTVEPGEFEEWMEWTQCSTTCGLGRRARRRECKILEDAEHVVCTGRILETQDCTQGPCPGITTKHNTCFMNVCTVYIPISVPCEWEYGEFGQCSATCGAAERSRFPIITQQPQHGGAGCPPFVVNRVPDVEPCNLRECPGKHQPWVAQATKATTPLPHIRPTSCPSQTSFTLSTISFSHSGL